MRENFGRRTVATINFVNDEASDEAVWTPAQSEEAEWTIADMATAHLDMVTDLEEHGEVWTYELPGLIVTALVTGGVVDTVIYISEDDLLRVHTALRTGRLLSIRYVKADGEVSRRRVAPRSLTLTKGGDYLLRAEDDRRDGDTRSFRWDRVTHTTLHRAVRRPAPAKSALWAEFERTLPQPEPEISEIPSEELSQWWLYDTRPDSPAALEAPESVQDKLADGWARGRRYVKVHAPA